MNFNQQANNAVNCRDFWKFPRNDNYFRSPNNPPSTNTMSHQRDFHMDNMFASERAIISAPYHFPFDGPMKNHAFPEPTHYPIANPVLEDLHQQVMSFHNPSTKMADVFPKALDIDLFLEEIFDAENAKAARVNTPNSSERSSNSDIAGSCQQPAPPPVPAPVAADKPEAATKKRVTKAYSPCQKIQYVDLFRKEHEEKGRSFSQRQFARKYQLSHARFSAWCKEYDKLKSLDSSQLMVSRVRMPSARFPVLESRVAAWIDEQRTAGHTEPTIKTIQTYARELATTLGICDFVASNTWVERFRRRCENKPARPTTEDPVRCPTPPTSMVGEILQDFIRRSATHQSPLEMAGLGISVDLGRADWTDSVKAKRVYTDKDRERFVEMFRKEKSELGGQCSLRLFCKRHNVSRARMTAWLKEGSSDESM